MSRRWRLNEAGFSLVELIMVIVILSILSIGFGKFLSKSVDGWEWTEDQADNSAAARMALDRVAREIYAMPQPATSVTSMTATTLRFTGLDGSDRSFSWSGTKGAPFNYALAGTAHPLVAAADSVAFSYLDSSGNTTAAAASLWRVVATIVTGSGTHRTLYRTGIHVRNR